MAKTTISKAIREANKEHIKNMYDGDMNAFIKEIKEIKHPNESVYQTVYRMAVSGKFLITYSDQRNYLKNLFNQSDKDAAIYSDTQVFQRYCHVLARDAAYIPELKNL